MALAASAAINTVPDFTLKTLEITVATIMRPQRDTADVACARSKRPEPTDRSVSFAAGYARLIVKKG